MFRRRRNRAAFERLRNNPQRQELAERVQAAAEYERCSFYDGGERCDYLYSHPGPHSWEPAHNDGADDAS